MSKDHESNNLVLGARFELIEDVPKEVDNFAKLGTLGLFTDALDFYKTTLRKRQNLFPVLVEYLKLLAEQNDLATLGSTCDEVLSTINPYPSTDHKDNGPLLKLVTAFRELATMHAGSSASVAESVYRHESQATTGLTSPLISASVERYHQESTRLTSPLRSASVKIHEDALWILTSRLATVNDKGRTTLELITAVISIRISLLREDIILDTPPIPWDGVIDTLLNRGQFWLANVALDCFLHGYDIRTTSDYRMQGWISVSKIVLKSSFGLSEARLVGTVRLLQTYCEALFNNGGVETMGESGWQSAYRVLCNVNKDLAKKIGEDEWRNSRLCRRWQLLSVDMSMAKELRQKPQETVQQGYQSFKYLLSTIKVVDRLYMFYEQKTRPALRELAKLKSAASQTGDGALESSIQWRINVLSTLNPNNVDEPVSGLGFLPRRLYSRLARINHSALEVDPAIRESPLKSKPSAALARPDPVGQGRNLEVAAAVPVPVLESV